MPNYGQKTFIENGKLNGILPLDESGKVKYQVVKTLDSLSKDELYKRGKKWFEIVFSTGKNTVNSSEASSGEIRGEGLFLAQANYLGMHQKYKISHKLSLEVKDKKYRIILSDFKFNRDFTHTAIDEVPMATKKFYDTLYPNIDAEAKSLLISLEKALATHDDF